MNTWNVLGIEHMLRWSRPELDIIKEKYNFEDFMDIGKIFEDKLSNYLGAKYAVLTDSCTHAMFLSLKYLESINKLPETIVCPNRTWHSVPMYIKHAGCNIKFNDFHWSGWYRLRPTFIWDSAARFTKNMFKPLNEKYGDNIYVCGSMQIKKLLPIGRGGFILTNDFEAVRWLRKARYAGRDFKTSVWEDDVDMLGWHYYMTPEDSARGIIIFDELISTGEEEFEDINGYEGYPDLAKNSIFGG